MVVVVELDVLDGVGWNTGSDAGDAVLEKRLGFHRHFLDGDSIHLYISATVVGYSRELAQEAVEVGSFWKYEVTGIECQGVALGIVLLDLILVLGVGG